MVKPYSLRVALRLSHVDTSRHQRAGTRLEGSIGLILPEKPNNIISNSWSGSYSSSAIIFSPFVLPCVEPSCSCRYIDYGRMKMPIDLRRFPFPARKNSEYEGVSVWKFQYLKALVSVVWR